MVIAWRAWQNFRNDLEHIVLRTYLAPETMENKVIVYIDIAVSKNASYRS